MNHNKTNFYILAGMFFFLLVFSSTHAANIDHGRVLEGLSMESSLLKLPVNYAIYLPPDYENSTRRYPVVYLLHGYSDDESAWIQFGEVNLAADRAIGSEEIPPMIIVMPDAGVTWYINDVQRQKPWEDMFIQEFIPFIDAQYRTRAKKQFRGISGLSMGGWGSLVSSLRYPDVFSACAALSSGVFTDDEISSMDNNQYEKYFSNLFGHHLEGKERLNDYYKKYSPLELASSLPVQTLKKVRWYIDCGDDDFLHKGNAALHILYRDRGIPHEYRVRDGAHSWGYWRSGITGALKFIGQSFHR